MQQICSFCSEPSILHCVIRSLYHKHNNQDLNKEQRLIDQLIQLQSTASLIKYREVLLMCDGRQFMNEYISGDQAQKEYKQLLEYYKYRVFVPIFAKSPASERALNYYYQKLKVYYKKIKRKLNITVEPSSNTSSFVQYSNSQANRSTKQELLKDLKQELEMDKKKKKIQPIAKYKSQSKALQELVSYLKFNKNFDNIKTLKTQDCFNQQNIFQQTLQKKSNLNLYFNQEELKPKLKSKLFKKIIEDATCKKQIPVFQIYREKSSTQMRSKSIKVIKNSDQKQTEKNSIGKASQLNIKSKERYNPQSIPKKNSSLTKITQNHQTPYKRKAISNEKSKAATIEISKKSRSSSLENMKLKNFDSNFKTKQPLIKVQVMKFQNTQPYKSIPSSPLSSRKPYRPGIQVTKIDNILSIRKKKLEALKQKANKK